MLLLKRGCSGGKFNADMFQRGCCGGTGGAVCTGTGGAV
jgi:hypothetical protein